MVFLNSAYDSCRAIKTLDGANLTSSHVGAAWPARHLLCEVERGGGSPLLGSAPPCRSIVSHLALCLSQFAIWCLLWSHQTPHCLRTSDWLTEGMEVGGSCWAPIRGPLGLYSGASMYCANGLSSVLTDLINHV